MPGSPEAVSRNHLVSFTTQEPYCSLGSRNGKTRQIWVVFHGMGQLSRYFLRHFRHLDPGTNYILAPQAPSLYYINDSYNRVGASWLTREESRLHMANRLAYLDAISEAESLDGESRLRLFGYSQGISILCRWLAKRQPDCNRIQLYAGSIPQELSARDFDFLSPQVRVDLFLGDNDPFIPEGKRDALIAKASEVFADRIRIIRYSGGHEIQEHLIIESPED